MCSEMPKTEEALGLDELRPIFFQKYLVLVTFVKQIFEGASLLLQKGPAQSSFRSSDP